MASMILDRAYRFGTTDPRIDGSFIEHLGRAAIMSPVSAGRTW